MLTQELTLPRLQPRSRIEPRVPQSQPLRPETEEMLRDIAYVLHLTRRVRSEIEETQR
jgi:hypothetical protein